MVIFKGDNTNNRSNKKSYLEVGMNALNIKLTDEEIKYLEKAYILHDIVGAL